MNKLLWRLLKLPNYWRAFPPAEAIRLLVENELGLAPSTSNGQLKVKTQRYGTIFLRKKRSDRAIFWQCLVMRQYDLKPFKAHNSAMQLRYNELLNEGKIPLIIDCGGNIGLSAIWFASTFPKARIVTIEPDEDNFSMLKKNITSYPDHITPIHGAIWSRHDQLQIKQQGRGGAGASVIKAEGKVADNNLVTYTIDDLLEVNSAAVPFLIKIDIEGAQKMLFSENTEWTKNFPCFVLELEDWLLPWQGTSTSFFSCMSKLPMDYLIKGENIFCFRHELNK
jgi:FkbM family methyltransferase